ncbi:nucleotide exchange factor GrpE [Undibacterium sp. FT79W]|uniref:nucleotide exchange factor GrpE n=1 Tax=Undibacterium sp. FT79W TaxID=2762296 RepID=UPI00164B3131|nr:nucleotide exchange factor GrpE [Undibacterium sp. FT79W]MBC3878358.1 nucleotide exchange factor GrpE [Undibacterium sp. FT79W]
MQEQENRQVENPATAVESAEVAAAETVVEQQNDPANDAAAKIAELEARVAELQDAFMRAKADGENIRRRAQEDVAKAHKFAIEGFAEAMVPVKDSLEMALKVETPSIDSLKEGVEITLKQLNSAFEKNRLLEVNPAQAEKLDPTKHQAVSMVPAEQEANTIVTVLQKGYTIADRLLRPALVTVAQGK